MFALAGHHNRGYSSGLGLALRVLGLEDRKPGQRTPASRYPSGPGTRKIIAGANTCRRRRHRCRLWAAPRPGCEAGCRDPRAAGAARVTLSLERRLRLLDWAAQEGVWVIEDDYLSELQLKGRAAPALASLDRGGRVIHIGTFSKTISPTLRLGFIVAPISLLSRFAEVAACLAPAPGRPCSLRPPSSSAKATTCAIFAYQACYSAQRDALLECLQLHIKAASITTAGLAALLRFPDGAPDTSIAREPWRLEWHQLLCQPGTHGRLPDDRASSGHRDRYQTSISLDTATSLRIIGRFK